MTWEVFKGHLSKPWARALWAEIYFYSSGPGIAGVPTAPHPTVFQTRQIIWGFIHRGSQVRMAAPWMLGLFSQPVDQVVVVRRRARREANFSLLPGALWLTWPWASE